MEKSRTQNAKLNIIAGFINKVIMLLFPFLIRTVLVRTLGTEYLGLNSLFSSILQVLNLAELGFSSAVVFSMYKPIAEKDKKTICALMNLYKKIYNIIGIVVFSVGICLMPFLKFLINGSYPQEINLYVVFLLYLINTSFTYFLFAYKNAILVAHQRSDITSNVLSLTSIIQYILQIVILYTTKNYYLYMIANLATTALNNILVNMIATKKYPQYICKGKINNELKKDIKKRVTGLMINKICQTTRNSFDSIFISAFLGLDMVAIYNNYYTIMSAIIALMSIVGDAILAGVGNSIVTETREKNYADLKKINFIYMWVAGIATACMLNLYQPFMKIWMGENMLLPFRMVILFCIYFFVLKMGDIRSVYTDANGLWWENRYKAILESIANIVLNYILGKYLGLYGIVLATIISLFFINFLYGSQILFKYYFTNVLVMDYFKQQGLYAITTLIVCFITYDISNSISINNNILNLVTRFIITFVVGMIIYSICYCKNINFRETKKMIREILKRKAN